MKGLVLLLQKHPEEARREFHRAIELRPGYVTPRLYLAVMARLSGDYRKAEAEYEALARVAPHLPAGYLGEAQSLMLLRRGAEALNVLEAWKTVDHGSVLPFQVLANIDLASHEPQKAIAQLQAALVRSPHDSATLTLLGTAYAAAGNTRSAMFQYEAALAADAGNADAALRLGELEAGQGQTERALGHFRDALNADPGNKVACNNAAWLLAEQNKDLDDALRLATRATERDPKYADGQDTLGWIRYRRGEYAEAISTLKIARALAPSRTDIAAHLNLAYAKANKKARPFDEPARLWLSLAVVIAAVLSAAAVRHISRQRRATANL
jgi:tetratricopeptide (TPR) repeat protein